MGWEPPSGIVLLRTLIASCASSRLLKLRVGGGCTRERERERVNVGLSNANIETIEWIEIDCEYF